MSRLWDCKGVLNQEVLRYTAGDDHVLDDRLVPYDIRASRAHAEMLHACGFLSEEDWAALDAALAELGAAHQRGEWRVTLAEEDCHTAIENRLVAQVGEAGRRIHLGRSRNDQVLAAVRLWLKDALEELARGAEGAAAALDQLGERYGSLPMPGYTHLQPAMPSTVGLWLAAFARELRDDAEGLRAAQRRVQYNPLGSAAGYGVPVVALDRHLTTVRLGFLAPHEPVTAVQLSRGKAEAGALLEATLLARDCGRLGADICLFATHEFGFVRLPPSLATGSSMLPGKRNPDLFELMRGRTAEAIASLVEVLTIAATLPSGYHRDLQLIKKPLLRGVDSALATVRLLAQVVTELELDAERLQAATAATPRRVERAYQLVVETGMAFRDAYRLAEEG